MNGESPLLAVLLLIAMRGGPGPLNQEAAWQPPATSPAWQAPPPAAGPASPAVLQPLPLAPVTRPTGPRNAGKPVWQTMSPPKRLP